MATLLAPTSHLEIAKQNLTEVGYCILANALTEGQRAELVERLTEQAAIEKREGLAFEDGGLRQQWGDFRDETGRDRRELFRAESGGVNQRVWMLVNKGRCFVDLLYHQDVLALTRSVIGEEFQLSSHGTNIARQGGVEMPLHTDQWWMPAPVDPASDQLPVGSLTRTRFSAAPESSPRLIAPAACVNVLWMLCDISEENGGTRLVPGSHLSGRQPTPADDRPEDVVSAQAPAGSALIIDGRLWHGTGANRTDGDRLVALTTFCGPQFRPQENYTLGVAEHVLQEADSHLRGLLGFGVWNGYGRTGDPTDQFVGRSTIRQPISQN